MIELELQGKSYKFDVGMLDECLEREKYIKKQRMSFKEFKSELPEVTSQDLVAFTDIFLTKANLVVQHEEENAFDNSRKGFYYDVWRALRATAEEFKTKDADEGVNAACKFWNTLTNEEKVDLRFAVAGVDQRLMEKNSDGPTEGPAKTEAPQPKSGASKKKK